MNTGEVYLPRRPAELDTRWSSVAKIATGHGRAAAAVVQAAIWNNPAMKVA
jgi:hypothetical protein